MPNYVLVSFDFGGTSAVKVHCVTKSEAIGRSMYATVADRHKDANAKRQSTESGSVLVELVELPDDFSSSDGHILFWGPDKPKTILTNND